MSPAKKTAITAGVKSTDKTKSPKPVMISPKKDAEMEKSFPSRQPKKKPRKTLHPVKAPAKLYSVGLGVQNKGVTKRTGNPRVWGKDRKNCPACGILQGGKELATHLRNEHGGGYCKECRTLHNTADLLQQHLKEHEGDSDASMDISTISGGKSAVVSSDSGMSLAQKNATRIKKMTSKPHYIVKKSISGKKGKKYLD